MNKEKECRKMFEQIAMGRENQSYSDWRKWVRDEIKDYSKEKLINLIKRTEIKMKKAIRNEKINIAPLLHPFITFAAMLVPFVGTVILTIYNIQFSTYDFEMEMEIALKFSQIVGDSLLESGFELIDIAFKVAFSFLIIWGVAGGYDMWSHKRAEDTRLYYEELLKILQELEPREKNVDAAEPICVVEEQLQSEGEIAHNEKDAARKEK